MTTNLFVGKEKTHIYRQEYFGGFLYDKASLWYDLFDKKKEEELFSGKIVPLENIDFRLHETTPNLALFSPIRVYYETTKDCNLHCKTCFNKSGTARLDELNTEESLKLIENLRDIDVIDLRFTGGEFTKRPDWNILLKHSKDVGLITSMNTNGILNSNALEELVAIDPHQITVSIDGPEKVHDAIRGEGTFKKALNSLQYLKLNGTGKLRVNAILNQNTNEFIEETVKIASEFAPEICFIYMWPLGRGQEIADKTLYFNELIKTEPKFKELGQKYGGIRILSTHQGIFRNLVNPIAEGLDLSGCAGGFRTLSISSDGRIYSCAYFAEMEAYKGEHSLGNVKDPNINIFDIWHNSDKLKEFREQVINVSQNCRSCGLLTTRCMGTCAAMDLYKNKVNEGKFNPYCYKDVKKR